MITIKKEGIILSKTYWKLRTKDLSLYIYYGAADSFVACASVSLSALVAELLT